jgi:L-amino acid N-acyltransferase YncA
MISIRLAEDKDIPEILTIYNDIILNTTAVYEYQPQTLAMRKAWYAAKLKDGYPVYVAVQENTIAGFSSIGPFRAWAAYKYSVENSVYVASHLRGQGIGKLLLPPLLQSAREKDLHVIIASINSDNLSSIRLHQSFGFEEVAHFKQVGFKFGKWLDLKFFELILDSPKVPTETTGS